MVMVMAGFGGWGGVSAADAHDAGWVCGFGEESRQVMLMMLAGLAGLERCECT